jgi:hypothetical protein
MPKLKLGKKQKWVSVKPGELELRRGELPPRGQVTFTVPRIRKRLGDEDDGCPSAQCRPPTGPYWL